MNPVQYQKVEDQNHSDSLRKADSWGNCIPNDLAIKVIEFCDFESVRGLNVCSTHWRSVTTATPRTVLSNKNISQLFAIKSINNMTCIHSTSYAYTHVNLRIGYPVEVISNQGQLKVINHKNRRLFPLPVFTLDYQKGKITITPDGKILQSKDNKTQILHQFDSFAGTKDAFIIENALFIQEDFRLHIFDLKTKEIRQLSDKIRNIVNFATSIFLLYRNGRIEKWDHTSLPARLAWIISDSFCSMECSRDGKTLLARRTVHPDNNCMTIDTASGNTRAHMGVASYSHLWNNHFVVSANVALNATLTLRLHDAFSGREVFSRNLQIPNFIMHDFKVLPGTEGLVLAANSNNYNRIPQVVRNYLTCFIPCWDRNKIDVFHFKAKDKEDKIKT